MRFVPVVIFWAAGCGASSEAPPADSGDTPEPPACAAELALTHGEGGCFGADDAWEFKADVMGCAESAVLNMWRTDGEPWDEQHPMALYDEGPDRVWQAWTGGPLAHAAPTDAWVPGTSSAFDCQADLNAVTFAVRLFDADGTLRSCATWGHDPERIVAGEASALNGDPAASFTSCEIKAW